MTKKKTSKPPVKTAKADAVVDAKVIEEKPEKVEDNKPEKTAEETTKKDAVEKDTVKSDPEKKSGFPTYTLLASVAIIGMTYIATKDIVSHDNSSLKFGAETSIKIDLNEPDEPEEVFESGLSKDELNDILSAIDKEDNPNAEEAPTVAETPSTKLVENTPAIPKDNTIKIPVPNQASNPLLDSTKNTQHSATEDVLNDYVQQKTPDALSARRALQMEDELSTLKFENEKLKKQLRTLKNLQTNTALKADVSAIHTAIAQGDDFAAPLARLSSIDNTPISISRAIAKLDALPTRHVMKQGELKNQLIETAREYQSRIATGEGASIWKKTMHNLTSSIHVRKVGEQHTGDDDGAIIARAEAQLKAGDVDAALSEMSALSPDAAKFFADWMSMAKSQNTATEAARTMKRYLDEGDAS